MSFWRLWRGRVLFFTLLLFTLSITYAFTTWREAIPGSPLAEMVRAEPLSPTPDMIGTANCRYGAAAEYPQTPWLPTVGAGWYITFGTGSSNVPDTEFVQFVTVNQNKNGSVYLPSYTATPPLTDIQLGAVIDANPGNLWVIGNEMERVGQGEIYPDIYAIAYHDVYHYIKQRDPSAQVALGALVQVTPSRLEYLDLVWESYIDTFGQPIPVDIYTFHLYILPEVSADGVTPNGIASTPLGVGEPPNPPFSDWRRESGGNSALCSLDEVYCFAEHTDMNVFTQQVEAFRQWMKDKGQQDKPLLLTEYSVLYPYVLDPGGTCFIQDEYGNCFTPQRVRTFLQNTANYLNSSAAIDPNLGYPADGGRLVQQWLWYKMNTIGVGDASNLLINDYLSHPEGSTNALTIVGQRFRTITAAAPLTVNLLPYKLRFIQTSSTTVDVQIQVINNGNTEVTGNYTVKIYADPDFTTLIGTTTITGTPGCARPETTATITWGNLSSGSHEYYVRVDANNNVPESNELDNVAQGFVLMNPQFLYLPQLPRP